jgi:hypothetical protein
MILFLNFSLPHKGYEERLPCHLLQHADIGCLRRTIKILKDKKKIAIMHGKIIACDARIFKGGWDNLWFFLRL